MTLDQHFLEAFEKRAAELGHVKEAGPFAALARGAMTLGRGAMGAAKTVGGAGMNGVKALAGKMPTLGRAAAPVAEVGAEKGMFDAGIKGVVGAGPKATRWSTPGAALPQSLASKAVGYAKTNPGRTGAALGIGAGMAGQGYHDAGRYKAEGENMLKSFQQNATGYADEQGFGGRLMMMLNYLFGGGKALGGNFNDIINRTRQSGLTSSTNQDLLNRYYQSVNKPSPTT